ncbi:MAG: hypothetical protein WCF08_04435 [Anaerolineaceae bacterium]
MSIRVHFRNITFLILLAWLSGPGMLFPQKLSDSVRKYTRALEFDYFNWTVENLWVKATEGGSSVTQATDQKKLVFRYLRLVGDVQNLTDQITNLYSDPDIIDPAESTNELSKTLDEKQSQLQTLTPDVEAILQQQVSEILAKDNLKTFSVLFPPVLYHTSAIPLSLFVSPRDRIQLEANISLQPVLSIAQKVALEKEVERGLNVSALVEPVGGLGTYPTMVMLTTDLNWLVETIAHEWVHNYLTLYPLGQNYDTTPELRTMNETTANLAGKEIGTAVIQTYYPELFPSIPSISPSFPTTEIAPPRFDFQKEMRITRIETDRLLSEGKITEAEAYMEARRRVFWSNGYLLRRINQAYFAFYGAYNDSPGGGAAGTDLVGPAVVSFREMNDSLADFLRAIARMASFSQLEDVLKKGIN